MRTILAHALALATVMSLLSAAAYAQPPAHSEIAEEGSRKFPMPAAEFRQHVTERLEKARARMEERITTDHLSPDQAEALRTTFKSSATQINAKVDQVAADGTVTKEEAEAVHELVRSLLHHHQDK